MRIWSIHPRYLDSKGLVALWRETLLAQYVLNGKTKGYTNHPQLIRFKELDKPVEAINFYLSVVWEEASNRGYKFDRTKIDWSFDPIVITVSEGQVEYEIAHLKNKLAIRDITKLSELNEGLTELHPMFVSIPGPIADWEVL